MRVLLFACLAAALAGEASAQGIELLDPPPPRRAPREDRRPPPSAPRENLFIAPSGEPFRSPPGAAYPVSVWFARADADHDGRLTLKEFVDDSLTFFKQLDVNNDGVIDGFEAGAYERTIVPELSAQRADRGFRAPARRERTGGFLGFGSRPAPIRTAEGAALYGLINEPQPVSSSDGDLDRRITLAEATTAATRRFRRLDTDNDGVLRLDTLPKTPAQTALEAGREARR
ncbi:MAG: hypothetical protein BGN86_00725 [Caulobacterales bacterium 68-7]|nr:hypothetical protein [Caulobacterales bacterium]OJU10656.1 MAG: hypothetical protein BGN86_00725 [Caulobacterales bacterium 68-7]